MWAKFKRIADKIAGAVIGAITYPIGAILTVGLIILLPAFTVNEAIFQYKKSKLQFAFYMLAVFPFSLLFESLVRAALLYACSLGTLAAGLITTFYGAYQGYQKGVKKYFVDNLGEMYQALSNLFSTNEIPCDRPSNENVNAAFETSIFEASYQEQLQIIKDSDPEKLHSAEVKAFINQYEGLICPITLQLPADPVQLSCIIKGTETTYLTTTFFEKSAIEELSRVSQKERKAFSNPLNRDLIIEIVPATKQAIEDFCKTIKTYVKNLVESQKQSYKRISSSMPAVVADVQQTTTATVTTTQKECLPTSPATDAQAKYEDYARLRYSL
jgi:hypothetical protein